MIESKLKEMLANAGVVILDNMKGPVDLYNGTIIEASSRMLRKADVNQECISNWVNDVGLKEFAFYQALDRAYAEVPTTMVDPDTYEVKAISKEAGEAAYEASQVYLIRAYFNKEK